MAIVAGAIAGLPYVRNAAGAFECRGRPDVLPTPPSRDDLVYGTDKPTADTTGVIPGSNLTPYTPAGGAGSQWTISTPDSVWEDLDINGGVKITAANVTVRNCRIRGYVASLSAGIWRGTVDVQDNGAAGYHIVDCTIECQSATELHLGVYGDAGGTVERCDISGGVDGARVWGAATSFLGCWIHDMQDFPVSAYTPADGPHVDGIQLAPAAYTGAFVIRGNLISPATAQPLTSGNYGPSAIMLPQQVTDLTIDKNWFEGTTCWPINVGGGGAPTAGTVLTITDNVITPGWYVSSGTTGHIIARADWQAIWTQTGNTDVGGGAIRVKNG